MILLFDIDYTLIDTSRLKKIASGEVAHLLGISNEGAEKLYEDFVKTLKSSIEFSPEKYAQFLEHYFADATVEKVISGIFGEPAVYQQATYPNTIQVLEKLRQTHRLGIFSEGVKDYQMNKLTLSGIINYLEKDLIFIYPDKTGKVVELVKKLGEIYFVDDSPKHIKDIAETFGAHPIWLKRGPKAQTSGSLNCPTILSLKELGIYCSSRL